MRIAITMGDPLGIGPEIVAKALQHYSKSPVQFKVYGEQGKALDARSAGKASVEFLEAALQDYSAGKFDALVTAPISKEHVSLAGFGFPGHTEYLASKTNTTDFLMMMAATNLKVTLVTIHESLSKVPGLLTQAKIIKTIQLTHAGLKKDFNIEEPKLAVCGLNPHAGEKGKFGREEIEIIAPAIEICRAQGIWCEGPKVPDAIFHEAVSGKYDVVVCMYHDQGLIPFKLLHFKDGVNVTLGLPLVRTSPDHGTAFDIAGQGIADPSSMIAAIELAIEIVKNRNRMSF